MRVVIFDSLLHVLFGPGKSLQIADSVIVDGNWHAVAVDLTRPEQPTVMLDNITQDITLENPVNFAEIIESDDIFVGGQPAVVIDLSEGSLDRTVRQPFKGCLDEVRLGEVLLPIFTEDTLVNNTAADRFIIVQSVDVLPGCHGDAVCSNHACENGAMCRDVWNDYECDCSVGFNGSRCEHNIDDCPGNDCANGATCIDGVAEFTCICVLGFTGLR